MKNATSVKQTKCKQLKTILPSVHSPQELLDEPSGETKIDLSEIIAFARKEETIKILRNFVNDGIDSGRLGRFHLRNVS